MIVANPYATTTQRMLNVDDVKKKINEYITVSYGYIKSTEEKLGLKIKAFENSSITLNPVFLYGTSAVETEIPSFSHPLVNYENNWIAYDLRSFVKANAELNTITVRNTSEFELAINRFILSGLYAVENVVGLYSAKFAHTTFASWFSENLTKKFGLNLGDQHKLKILASIYYAGLFTNDFQQEDYLKLTIRLKDEFLLKETFDEVYEAVGTMKTIQDLCDGCFKATNNVRLKGMDYNILINIFSNTWIGTGGREMAVLSLEHPPTWMSLVYASIADRSYKRSSIATTVNKDDKRGKGKDYLTQVSGLVSSYKIKAQLEFEF